MAITLEANYSKKIGLPGYSLHQCSLTVKTEVSDISKFTEESKALFTTLQSNVDRDIQQPDWMAENVSKQPQSEASSPTFGYPLAQTARFWHYAEYGYFKSIIET